MQENTFKEQIHEESEEIKEKPVAKKRKENTVLKGFHSVLDGTFLTKEKVVKNLPFLFFIAFLAFIYIGNSYYAEKKIIEIEKVKKDLKELRSEDITTRSKLMNTSKQSEIVRMISLYGVKESVTPPEKLLIVKDTLK